MRSKRRERLPLGRRLRRAVGKSLLALSLLAAGCWGAIYQWGRYHLEAGQSALILQAGQLVQTVRSPGWHMHLPRPFQNHIIVGSPGGEHFVVGADPGDGTSSVAPPAAPPDADAAEAIAAQPPFFALTRDARVLRLRYRVEYEVDNPVAYHFQIRAPEAILRGASAAGLRAAVAARSSEEFAAVARGAQVAQDATVAELERDALFRLRAQLRGVDLGLRVHALRLEALAPPPTAETIAAELEAAEREGRRKLEEVKIHRHRVVSQARGRALQLIEAARGDRDAAIAAATGEAERFQTLAEEYLRAPDVVRTRLWLETLEVVLPAATGVFVAPPGTVLPPSSPRERREP